MTRSRRPDPWRAAFFGVAAAAIVAGAAWALLGSSFLVVRSVTVTGTRMVPDSAVIDAAGIKLGTPLVRLNTAAVARRVERITLVRSARVSKDWPDRVVISVRERTPALAVRRGTGFALIDSSGVIVRTTTARPRGMPSLLSAPATVRGSPAVCAAVTVLGELPPRIRHKVLQVSAPSANAVTLHLRGRITIAWGGTARPAAKRAELAILMRTGASSYDVSDPATAMTGK